MTKRTILTNVKKRYDSRRPGAHRRSVSSVFIAIVFFIACLPSGWAQPVPFVYFGHVFLAYPDSMTIRRVGALAPSAPAVAADPQGRLWGRLEKNVFGALDPATGAAVVRVVLQYPVYNHTITASGKAYVTHATLAKDGFTVSVVDTGAGKTVRELAGIVGLRTDLTADGDLVWLATVGTGRGDDGALRLYRIDAADDSVREILAEKDGRRALRLAAANGRLYLARVARTGADAPATVELRDGDSGRVRLAADAALWGKGRRLAGLYAAGGCAYLICETANGSEIAVAGADLKKTIARFRMPGPVSRILAARGDALVYLDRPFEAGYRDVSLVFYDTRAGKEVKRIGIPGFLASPAGEKRKSK